MTELYIVRHGETDTNHEGRVNGRATNLPLNQRGKEQLENLRQYIDINSFDEVYSSPLKRALESAEILNQGVHEIKTDDRLAEIYYGSWDGLKMKETREKYPDAFDENLYILPNYTKYATDGESNDSVYNRVRSFLKDISKKKNKKILVVCHGFISRSFFKVIMQNPNIEDVVQPENAAVSKYKISESGHPYLIYYGRVSDIESKSRGTNIHE